MTEIWINQLLSFLPADQVSTEPEILTKHSHDASTHPPFLPGVVVWPLSTNDVVKVLQLADQFQIPVTVAGARTGLEGNAIPIKGGIVLDMTRMNHVIEVRPEDFQVVVQPGIIGTELNKHLEPYQLMFPAFPASANFATVGGMIANNAGGMYAVKYGVVGNWVMAMEVVMADGKVIQVGSRSIKSVAGYDLKSLVIGSEGTLGIVTKATLKVVPLVSHKFVIVASFPSVQAALTATLSLLHHQLDPVALELLDAATIRYVNGFKQSSWAEAPTLLIEIQGLPEELQIRGQTIQTVCQNFGSSSMTSATTPDEVAKIWEIRSLAYPALMAAHPGATIIPGDVGVPLSQIPTFMDFVEHESRTLQIEAPTFGHIGDGNFHFWLIYRKDNQEETTRAQELARRLVSKALALGGTCTAEHGIGIGKQAYLAQEHSDSLYLMKLLKQTLDPKGILNPGKIFQ